jgi:Protein of unknown function (DUF2892)
MAVTTINRVPKHTPAEINKSIEQATEERIQACASQGPTAIKDRLVELDHEWDIERAIEANAAFFVVAGVTLGVAVDRRWLALPAAVGAFLLQHALQGWCPPVPVLRRLGFRTSREIEVERNALKAVRGDFGDVGAGAEPATAQRALAAAR